MTFRPRNIFIILVVASIGICLFVYSNRTHHIDKVPVVDLELSSIIVALKQYYQEYNSFPKGTDGEIGKALLGSNEKRITFLYMNASRIDPQGVLLDPWGTPYKIQISGMNFSVTSAGPNKKFLDNDDKSRQDHASK